MAMRKLCVTAQFALIVFLSLVSLHLNLPATIITHGTSSNFNSASAERDRVQVRGDGEAARLELEYQWSADMSLLTTPPDKRYWAAMAYAPAINSAILFGGRNSAPLGDVYKFDVNTRTWNPVTIGGNRPSGRFGHRMAALDSTSLLIFGGHNGTSVLNDTWIFDSSDNSWHELTTLSTMPAARALYAMERAKGTDAVVLFGGNDNTIQPLSDTWVFNINNTDIYQSSWTLCHPASNPSARDRTCMGSGTNGAVYLFGGNNGSNPVNEIWSYNVGNNTWTNHNPSDGAPSVRQDAAMFYDVSNERFAIFGGQDEFDGCLNDIWYYYTVTNKWNGSFVTALSTPAARSGHCLTYIPSAGKALLFGGLGASAEDYQDTLYFFYRSSGVFTSGYLEANYSSTLQWTRLQVEPQVQQEAGLNISFQFAASDDQQSWSDFYGPGASTTAWFGGAAIYDIRELSQVLDNHRYIKYRAKFDATGNIPKTPLLDGVTITYNITPATVTLSSPLHGATTNQSKPAFYWNAATDPDAGDLLTYTIEVDDSDSFPVFRSSGIPAAVWVSTVSLTHDKWYRWRVRAFDGTVFGGWSGAYALYVDTVAPAAITNLAAEIGSGNGQIKLSWSSPGDNNFSGNIVNGS